MKAIYETKGRAREYCELAINLYTGCSHNCIYCYGAAVTHQDKERWGQNPQPRKGIIWQIQRDAERYSKLNEKRPVLMCFVTDPYQPVDDTHRLARKAILVLKAYDLRVVILTKAGIRAQRDWDLLDKRDAFATTLTLLSQEDSLIWEPGAALPAERMENLRQAHELGLETWVSCEPVIYPEATLELIKLTAPFVDHYKVGTLNYHPHGKTIDWPKFARNVKQLLEGLGKRYYLKRDLAEYLKGGEG
ncbi:hypothetical protein ES703_110208 [subsurface metagenome]